MMTLMWILIGYLAIGLVVSLVESKTISDVDGDCLSWPIIVKDRIKDVLKKAIIIL